MSTPSTNANLSPVIAPPHIHALLARLHAASAAQEHSLPQIWFYLSRALSYYLFGTATWGGAAADDHMRDKFVALEPEKCAFAYLLARSLGARRIVEAGTSFGVSTIYLALAVGQNAAAAGEATLPAAMAGGAPRVIATEKEPTKAARARAHWREAGEEVERWIDLREGDLLETLKEDVPSEIDMVLLDIWTPLALPTLQLLQPRLRRGALILTDNTSMARPLYNDLFAYLHDPAHGFRTTTVPFSGGLEVTVYLP